jgi:hypothetical protein
MHPVPYSRIWEVDFHDDFVSEFLKLAVEVQDELLAAYRTAETVWPAPWPPAR